MGTSVQKPLCAQRTQPVLLVQSAFVAHGGPRTLGMHFPELGLGGGAGGYIAGPKHAIDMIIQRGRPTLFSNALPATVACSADKAIEILMREPERVAKLKENCRYAREKIKAIGLEVIESPTAICPVIVGETSKAISMSARLLEMGVYVIGFGYPVVPEGEARLRCQISAAHEKSHIDQLVDALVKL